MKRFTALTALCALILLLAQCAPKVRNSTSSSTAVAAAPKELQEGKALFDQNCGRCHKLFQPESRTVAAWERILPDMSRKARLNERQAMLVHDYIIPNAKKG